MEQEIKVESKIQYNCGCGFKTDKFSQATLHAATTGHAIQVGGTIKRKA
jgi:hypothetical protein